MNLIFFTHPEFLGNKSMLRFGKLLSEGMAKRGHKVEAWSPPSVLSHFTKRPSIQKWLAYYDLYVSFPKKIKRMVKGTSADTLFVFTDQSLGLWVPIVANRPCVVH